MDIRVFKFSIVMYPKSVKSIIEIKCPTGKQLIQILPLQNKIDKDMEVNVTWTRNKQFNGDWFSGPNKYRVHRETGTKEGYPITFKPTYAGKALA